MILALDTAGPWVCAALGDESAPRMQARRTARLNHNELLPQVYRELVSSNSPLPTAVAVNRGPGTFTGTRVGVAFAAGLCQALGVPAFSVSSFQVAASLAPSEAKRVGVILPLVRDVWGVGLLIRNGDTWLEKSCVEMSTEELEDVRDVDVLLSPWVERSDALGAPADWNPAVVVGALAQRAGVGAFREPRELRAHYLGKSQAERVFEARHGG